MLVKSLTSIGLEAKEHLRKFRPKIYQQLKESGELQDYLLDLQDRAMGQLGQMIENGALYHEAKEIVNQMLFPPSEEEEPVLGCSNCEDDDDH